MNSSPSTDYSDSGSDHIVQFYHDELFLCDSVARYIVEGLRGGQGVLVIATATHLAGFRKAVTREYAFLKEAESAGQLICLDAEETLSLLLKDNVPDPARFASLIASRVEAAIGRFSKVRAYGELVNLLWSRGNLAATMALEEEWNRLKRRHSFTLLCSYVMGNFSQSVSSLPFEEICRQHSHVVPSEDYVTLNGITTQLRTIAHLQQRASALENEIKERRRIENELTRKSMELTEANEELARFAQVASHDLKEPLRSVMNFLQLASKSAAEKLNEKETDYLNFALEGIGRMNLLLESLLARTKVGTHIPERRPTDCNSTFDDAVSNLAATIAEAGATVTRDDLPPVSGDPVYLLQLFQNLIANGVKFAEGKAPTVHVRALKGPNEWLFSVEDNGIGIPRESLEKVFVPFARLHSPTKFPGFGLGLSTARKIVEAFGGKIWAESDPGRGSTFFLTLPEAV